MSNLLIALLLSPFLSFDNAKEWGYVLTNTYELFLLILSLFKLVLLISLVLTFKNFIFNFFSSLALA